MKVKCHSCGKQVEVVRLTEKYAVRRVVTHKDAEGSPCVGSGRFVARVLRHHH